MSLFILLTCRPPETDFRLPLAREVARLGLDVHCVYLKRRPTVTHLGSGIGRDLTPFGLLAHLRDLVRQSPAGPIVLNSTNLAFPGFSAVLRAVVGGRWILDLHDDLLYGRTGLRRWRGRVELGLLVASSHTLVHAAETLRELFPSSHHLGNASDQHPVPRPSPDWSKVLILASIDGRFDHALVEAAARAAPHATFDIHGQISGNDAGQRRRVEMLTRIPNVRYHGPYRNSDLPELLARYAVTFAPYVVDSPLTRYIDPLRYYHCLNSGMEVVTTPIPAAGWLHPFVHVARDAGDVSLHLKRLAENPEARRNDGTTASLFNWSAKASRLLQLAERA